MPFPLLLHRLLSFGRRSELQGIDYLRSLGFRVVASAYRTRLGEVDIIAWEKDVLVFVEVKARQSVAPPEDAVSMQKRERVIRAARAYIAQHRLQDVSCRFDILAVTAAPPAQPQFRLLRDAFRMYN